MGQIITPDGSFSGADIKIYAIINNSVLDNAYEANIDDTLLVGASKIKLIELAEIQTLSYSVYRGKRAVNVLGDSNPNGFTRGYRSLAGTIIFTVIKERAMHELLNQMYVWDTASGKISLDMITIDQLPPIDIFMSFENEVGNKSKLTLFGVEFMNEGQVMSIQDLITENSVNYLAKHISPMRSYDGEKLDITDLQRSTKIGGIPVTAEDYRKASEEIQIYKRRFL